MIADLWFNYALLVPFPSSPAFYLISMVTLLGTLSIHPISSYVAYTTFVALSCYSPVPHILCSETSLHTCIPSRIPLSHCKSASSAFTNTCANRLPTLDNPHTHVYFTSLLTAEPEPWSSEQDDYITGTEQDNNPTGIALWGHNTERGCQAVHSPPPVGPWQEHYIDRFDTVPTPNLLGPAARRWIE